MVVLIMRCCCRYTGEWHKQTDRAYIIPNALEAFVRSSLLYSLNANKTDSPACETSSDCGLCSLLDYDQVQMECISDICICPSAFYHLALDPGIAADDVPGYFSVQDISSPAYTEPYWSN